MAAGDRRGFLSRPRLIGMVRRCGIALLLMLSGCAGLEDGVRDINRNLYRTWSGNDARAARPGTSVDANDAAEVSPCFSADTGLLYISQTGRCAAGYIAVPAAEAERAFSNRRNSETTRTSSTLPPAATMPGAAMALCYDDGQGQIFEAAACPAGSRWVTTAEAASIQQAQLTGASWCYFSGRRLLYRSRACRPGDQSLSVAQADAMWEKLAPDRRPRQRPAEVAGGGVQAVPPVQAAPRGGVSATPLPSPK